MKTVIEMAQSVGFWQEHVDTWMCNTKDIEAFAELVRADEREKYKWDVHSCGPTCKRYACVAMREAVEAEREACERVAGLALLGAEMDLAKRVLRAIRARSNT